jgi:hypothetical protein
MEVSPNSNRIILSTLLISVFLSACSSLSYNYETAIKRGDIVDLHGDIKNAARFEEFNKNVSLSKMDTIRIIRYTIEGDPLINDLEFDGKEIKYTYDNSKDKHGRANIRSAFCTSLVNKETAQGMEYTLKGCYGKDKEVGHSFYLLLK